jgi:hypothetical protein
VTLVVACSAHSFSSSTTTETSKLPGAVQLKLVAAPLELERLPPDATHS